ncbi:MAG: peptidylprolyl isomerase [Myxococcota bacterium]
MKRLTLVSALALACAPALAPGQPGRFPTADADLVAANEALGDPHGGRFPFAQAMEGLAEAGPLVATLRTSAGDVRCTLDPGHAPLAVANFVGLARGTRPFRNADGAWVTEPYYVDVPWHRAEEGQFVQTGRRAGLADGGFLLQDEIGVGDDFGRAGVMGMAGTGDTDTSSVQFFVTTGPAKHLEGAHTVFGACDGEAALRSLEQAVIRGRPATLHAVEISRG